MTQRRTTVRFARTDTPPVNVVLDVWYPPEQREIAAVWDEQQRLLCASKSNRRRECVCSSSHTHGA